jgi:hypothetical protein
MRRSILPALLLAALASACPRSDRPGTSGPRTGAGNPAPSPLTLDQAVRPGDGDIVFVGAGDIARCEHLEEARQTGDLVRGLLRKHPGTWVFTAGDNAYADRPGREFDPACYQEVWGAFKDRTAPTPGNHEYNRDPKASPYFSYFPYYAAHPEARRGYYSFDLGSWHVVSLDSDPHGPPLAEQAAWLEEDLRATRQPCSLAVWHHPLFSSGDEHGGQAEDPGRRTVAFWEVLERGHADLIVNGHDHDYERFAPQDSDQDLSPTGPRQFVTGTGGARLRGVFPQLEKNSEAHLTGVPGVLVLTLKPRGYSWAFLAAGGRIYDPSPGDVACYAKAPS